MLAIQSGIAKYHCVYTRGAVAFQTQGFFSTHPIGQSEKKIPKISLTLLTFPQWFAFTMEWDSIANTKPLFNSCFQVYCYFHNPQSSVIRQLYDLEGNAQEWHIEEPVGVSNGDPEGAMEMRKCTCFRV